MGRFLPALVIAACSFGASTFAHAGGIGADIGIGTTGIRANVQTEIFPRVVIRGGYNYLEYELDESSYDGVEYDVEIDSSTIGAFVDVHPFGNGFTLTAGVYQGDKEVILTSEPDAPVTIGNITFTPEQVGRLDGKAELESTAPYVGLGWDSTLYRDSLVGFWVRGGAMFTGSPEVTLTSTGGLVSDQQLFLDELEREIQSLEDDIDDYEIYPVLSMGVSFGF